MGCCGANPGGCLCRSRVWFCSFLVDGFLVSKQKINVNGLREIFAVVRKLLSGGGGVCGELVV